VSHFVKIGQTSWYEPGDWMKRASAKWPILYRVGCKTLTQSTSEIGQTASPCQILWRSVIYQCLWRRPPAVLFLIRIFNCKYLSGVNMLLCAKFHDDWSSRCEDMAIYHFLTVRLCIRKTLNVCAWGTKWNIDVHEIATFKTWVKKAAMQDTATRNSCWKNSLQLFLRYLVD